MASFFFFSVDDGAEIVDVDPESVTPFQRFFPDWESANLELERDRFIAMAEWLTEHTRRRIMMERAIITVSQSPRLRMAIMVEVPDALSVAFKLFWC